MSEKAKLGSRVEVIGKDVKGKVAFIGMTQFSSGKWYGVILDEPKGKNNGSVQGKSYFSCPDNHGIFVRNGQLQVIDEDLGIKGKGGSPSPSASPGETTPAPTPKEAERRRNSRTGSSTPKFPVDKHAKDVANMAETPAQLSLPSSLRSSMIEGDLTGQSSQVSKTINSAANILEEKMKMLHKDQEIEQLKDEVKDLGEKLETIKIKRSEDQVKLKEFEKTKLQVQQLQEYKAKITEVQTDLQRQLAHAKKEAKEAIEAKEQHADEMSDLAEAMELSTLDKEMAEEKCETLQSELEHTKEKLEEMQIDLEILKAEMSEKGAGGAASSYQLKQLEQQNERLKEALVKMRDLSAHEKQEQQRNHKEIERQQSEINELSRTKEKLSSQVDECEKQISELKEQVDAALGCEEMVEQLSEKNLMLEDKVKELQVIVDDLERLQDINEQLQESSKETELELREEVDMANVRVREAQRKLEAMQEAIADYEQTIQKFRDQTEQLRDANHELRMQLQKESDRVAMATPVEFFDFKVKYAETKAFARAVEMDLRRLEVQEANQHVAYLCSFMPDNFLCRGSDHDAILILLLIPRMITKAEILISQIKEKFPPPDEVTGDVVLKTHKIDQSTFANRLLYKLYYLQSMLHQYVSSLSDCSTELFMKIGTLYMEMAVQEKAIDYYIDLLRKDQLDENVNLETLEKALNYFQSLYSVHLAAEKVDCNFLMADHMKLLMAASDSIYLDISSVRALIENHGNEFAALLKDVYTYADDIRQFVKKIRRRMPAEGSTTTTLLFGADVQEQLARCREYMGQVMAATYLLRKSAVQQVVMSGEANYISTEKIKELAHESTDKAYGKDDCGPECMRQSMSEVMTVMNKLANAMQEGEYDTDAMSETKSIPPVLLRAQAIKSEVKDLESLKFKIEARDGDIMELKKALKIKGDELSEMHVRKEMAEKKLEIATKDSDERIERIQRQLDEAKMLLKKKEKEFEETLDHLQADIDALETERGELKDKLKMMSKKALFEGLTKTSALAGLVASPTSPTVPSALSSGSHFSRDSSLLSQQVQDLQLALKHMKNENLQLQTKRMVEQLSDLPPLKLPSKPTGLASATGFVNMIDLQVENVQSENIVELAKMSSDLLNQSHELLCPSVVDISNRRPASQPPVDKAFPKRHLIDSVSKLRNLQKQTEKLKCDVANLKASHFSGGLVSADFATFPTPSFTKTLRMEEQLMGKVSIKSDRCDDKAIPLHLNLKELRQLHAKVLC